MKPIHPAELIAIGGGARDVQINAHEQLTERSVFASNSPNAPITHRSMFDPASSAPLQVKYASNEIHHDTTTSDPLSVFAQIIKALLPAKQARVLPQSI
jgi:hypothetical protein